MPELAEVESVRKKAAVALVGKRVKEVWAAEDRLVFDEEEPGRLAERMKGAWVSGTGRKGKYFWLEMEGGGALLLHLGMTGWMEFREGGDERPRFAKLELMMEDGSRGVFRDARRLGRIRWRNDPEAERPVSELGFDPLLALPAASEFVRDLRKRKAPVKAVLLDQGFSAGIGNWLADEILYQARIDPRRRANDLSDQEAKTIRSVMKRVVNRAVAVDADDERFPKSWLFHVRWGKTKGATTVEGHPLAFTVVGGRTTAWVPGRQG
ncbi:MAG TPA: DNA-formamidopyrimidine glycosylase family protein [Kiritimatiellia bacterium]|nr:DNA-formamidopyrimidine glycosylase family protein [Kiritimatiellia bacterium]